MVVIVFVITTLYDRLAPGSAIFALNGWYIRCLKHRDTAYQNTHPLHQDFLLLLHHLKKKKLISPKFGLIVIYSPFVSL